MHITILALGSTGDILPYTALGKGLKNAGHQVRFITFEGFESRVRTIGLDFYPIPGDPRSLVAQGGSNILSMAFSFGSIAADYAKALSSPHLFETDLLINQLPGGLFGLDLAEKAGIQMILAAVIPLAPSREFPLLGFPELAIPGYNKKTFVLGEAIVWQMFRKTINRWREETLGLAAISKKEYFGKGGNGQNLIVNGFSPLVVKQPDDWSDNIHITGYWFPEDPDWQPSSALVDFIEKGPPPIFIGFGSMPIKDPERVTGTIIQALKKMDQRAVMHIGWGGLANQELPDNIFKIDYAPYEWLFPKMSMVIHHGGSGTTGFALKAGVPSWAVPFGFDQVYWGKRIAALGVGPEPLRIQKLTAEKLISNIELGLSDLDMRHKAKTVGQMIRSEDGIRKAVNIIQENIN